MPLNCAAFGCKSRQGCSETKISFHRFPLRNPLLLKKWISKVRRKDWEPTIFSRLCGKHFTSDDYYISKGGRKFLKKDVAPSVFCYSSNFSENSNQYSLIQKDKLSSDKIPICAAVNCSNKPCRHKIPGKSIHRFPFSRLNILRQWIKNVRQKRKPSPTSVLGNLHFEAKCFNRDRSKIKLKPDAVPTIFDYSSAAEKDSQLHSERKEIASNADYLLDRDLLSTKRITKANTRVENTSPVLSEESSCSIEKSDYNYSSFPELNQDSVSDQSEEHAAEPATIHLNENRKSIESVESPFQKLGKRLKSVKKPSKWWGITRHHTFIMCTKWNEEYIAERRIVIDRKLNVKVFLYNSEVTNPELKKLQSAKDLTKILYTVDRYRILTESESLSLTNPTLSTLSKISS